MVHTVGSRCNTRASGMSIMMAQSHRGMTDQRHTCVKPQWYNTSACIMSQYCPRGRVSSCNSHSNSNSAVIVRRRVYARNRFIYVQKVWKGNLWHVYTFFGLKGNKCRRINSVNESWLKAMKMLDRNTIEWKTWWMGAWFQSAPVSSRYGALTWLSTTAETPAENISQSKVGVDSYTNTLEN